MAIKRFNAVSGVSVGDSVIIDVVDANANATLNKLDVTTTVTSSTLVSNVATGTAPFTVTSTTQVANLSVATAGTVITAAQPNITSVGTLSSVAVTANANVGNLNSSGIVYANNNIIVGSTGGEGGQIVVGYVGVNNITGQANGTWNMDVEGSNNFRLFNQNATGVISGITMTAYSGNNNVSFAGNVSAPYFIGNGSQLTGITSSAGSSIVNGTSNVSIPSSGGNVNTSVGGVANVMVVSSTQVTAPIFAATDNGNGTNFKIGDDAWIGDINTADTIGIKGQQNAANAYIVFGNSDSTGKLGRAGTGPLTYAGAFSATGNVTGGNITTAGQLVSSVATGTAPFVVTSTTQVANLSVATAGSSTTAGTVTTNAQPNITSVGTLTSLGVNGTVTAVAFTANTGVFAGNGSGLTQLAGANVTGTVANATYAVSAGSATTAGTVTTNAQPNITSVGTLSTLSVTGNIIGGSDLYIGNGASSTAFTNPIAIFKDTGLTYVQVAVVNSTGTGSADITTYGNNGDDTQSWTDIGFTGNTFNDANYTVTSAGDGYMFVQGNSSFGGNLVIATGNTGTTKDIVFATGGFLTANIKARLYNANGAFSVTGNVIGGNFNTAGILTSTLATGTAPIVVNSTTQVANLNVASAGSITNDTSTNSDGYYPLMSTGTSGAISATYVSSTKMYYNPSTGQLNATNFNSLSDETKKQNITPITDAVKIVSSIEGVEFQWKDNGKKSSGVIAQQLETVLPYLVVMSSDGTKSVNYSGMMGYLIEAIKEQQTQIDALKSEIQILRQNTIK